MLGWWSTEGGQGELEPNQSVFFPLRSRKIYCTFPSEICTILNRLFLPQMKPGLSVSKFLSAAYRNMFQHEVFSHCDFEAKNTVPSLVDCTPIKSSCFFVYVLDFLLTTQSYLMNHCQYCSIIRCVESRRDLVWRKRHRLQNSKFGCFDWLVGK